MTSKRKKAMAQFAEVYAIMPLVFIKGYNTRVGCWVLSLRCGFFGVGLFF